jgi:hypothetical protein
MIGRLGLISCALIVFIVCSCDAYSTSRSTIGRRREVKKTANDQNIGKLGRDEAGTQLQASALLAPAVVVAAAQPIAVLSRLLQMYETVLVRSPWTTKIISSGVIGGLGDILIQFGE